MTRSIAVENFIVKNEYLSKLREGNVQFRYKLYDVDDTVIAYYFTVKKNGENVGYFVTSARENIDPMLQYGYGDNIGANFGNEINKGNKIYYLGGLQYMYAKNSTGLKDKYKKAKQKSLKHSSEAYKEIKENKLQGLEKRKDRSPGWEALLKNIDSTSNATIASTSWKVLSVDRIGQRRSGTDHPDSSCGPATGAMIADYYHDVLGYSVRDNATYGSWAELTNHLYREMDTRAWGTSMNNWREGMLYHVRHDSSYSAWSARQWGGVGHGNLFVQAIDSYDPAALRFDYFVQDSTEHQYHFVAGIGYNKNGSFTGDLHVAYKNPDGGKNNDETHWIDWTVNDQDFTFAYMQ
ncbi:hypothetical protein [Virgibacillus sp. L01]|uniref:hypothetical protein n=1 Tax=Virgibacillus sp. L01 TaxID=3457429 RepID=UPI003FD35945